MVAPIYTAYTAFTVYTAFTAYTSFTAYTDTLHTKYHICLRIYYIAV